MCSPTQKEGIHYPPLLARAGNCIRGRWENFWAPEQPGALLLADPAAHLDKMGYGLTNPNKDHLVDTALNWPGVSSLSDQLNDKELVVKRPRRFFNPDGDMPEQASLRFARPPGFGHLSQQQWATLLRSEVSKREAAAAQERQRKGIKLLGRKAIRQQSPFTQPRSMARRRGMVPRVATRNKWLRIERLRRNKRFQHRYREALEKHRSGELDVVFPFGTYQLRLLSFVRCEPEPAAGFA